MDSVGIEHQYKKYHFMDDKRNYEVQKGDFVEGDGKIVNSILNDVNKKITKEENLEILAEKRKKSKLNKKVDKILHGGNVSD